MHISYWKPCKYIILASPTNAVCVFLYIYTHKCMQYTYIWALVCACSHTHYSDCMQICIITVCLYMCISPIECHKQSLSYIALLVFPNFPTGISSHWTFVPSNFSLEKNPSLFVIIYPPEIKLVIFINYTNVHH